MRIAPTALATGGFVVVALLGCVSSGRVSFASAFHTLLTRTSMVRGGGSGVTGAILAALGCHPSPPPNGEEVRRYRPPPAAVDYSTNPTAFGAILRGELPALAYAESDELFAFRDRTPRAPLHALVIPKRRVPTVLDLRPDVKCDGGDEGDDADLLESMRSMALDVVEKEQPGAFSTGDYVLAFHVPPFYSVDHLHVHVLAPASEMHWIMRHGKYRTGTPWCASLDDVLARLRGGGGGRLEVGKEGSGGDEVGCPSGTPPGLDGS